MAGYDDTIARSNRNDVLEEAAKLAEACAVGVAIEIGDLKTSLGVMCVSPAEAQRQTANAIAAAIRNLKN